MPIRTLIADDEPLARAILRVFLQGEADVEIAAETVNGPETTQAVVALRPDLLFLDVQMPGADGFKVLEMLPSAHVPVVVFVTAFGRHALRAFDFHARDYLLKPFTRQRFLEALNQARIQLATSQQHRPRDYRATGSCDEGLAPDRIVANRRGKQVLIDLNEVDWVKAEGNYTVLHVGAQRYMLRATLSQLLSRLPPRSFAQIHRSAIVNIGRIAHLRARGHSDYEAVLASGVVLKLSRHYRQSIFSALPRGRARGGGRTGCSE